MHWVARREDGDETRNETADDKDKPEVGWVAVAFAKAILVIISISSQAEKG